MYENILETLDKYRGNFPGDTQVAKYFEFLNNPENMGARCVDRKNFNGHITVSAFVLKNDGGGGEGIDLVAQNVSKKYAARWTY